MIFMKTARGRSGPRLVTVGVIVILALSSCGRSARPGSDSNHVDAGGDLGTTPETASDLGAGDHVDAGELGTAPADTAPPISGVGASACISDDDCHAQCERFAEELRQSAPARPASTSSRCEKRNYGGTTTMPPPGPTPPGCECGGPAGGIGLQPGLGDSCLLRGRAFQCLYTEAEFPGCDVTAPDTSCAAICRDADDRLNRDLAATFAAVAQGSRCTPGACDCVIALAGQCHLWPSRVPYDCSLSVAEIAQRELARRFPPAPPASDGPRGDPRQICAESIHCGLALSCKAGFCGACTVDADCAPGEGCALGVCLREAYIGCRSQADCADPDTRCVSSGLTGGHPRGNEATVARCMALAGGISMSFRSFSWTDQPSACPSPSATCAVRVAVDGSGRIARSGSDVPNGTATGQLPEHEAQELTWFLVDRQTTWVLEAPFTCTPQPGHHVWVEIVSGDGHTTTADVSGCKGPPFDQIAHWIDRLRALTGS